MKPQYQPVERIRNVGAFIKSYMKSGSGQRAITRQPRFVEVNTETQKGRVLVGFNTMAFALANATTK